MKEFIKRELSNWKAEVKLQDWMVYCLMGGAICYCTGANLLFLWLAGALVLTDPAIAIESSISIVLGLFLLGVFAWHYVKLNTMGK